MVMKHLWSNNSLKIFFPKKFIALKNFNSAGSNKKFTRWDLNVTNHDEIFYLKLNKHRTI